jgi:hypothetical protein
MVDVYEYEGFLTEEKLGDCLRFVFGEDRVKSQVKIPNTRMSWDYEVTLPEFKMYVEFDGHFHYSTANAIHNDQRKMEIAKDDGALVIRLPYFVQFDSDFFLSQAWSCGAPTQDLREFFEKKTARAKSFKHGFHADKVTLPASFTRRGALRFEKEINSMPYRISNEILSSLDEKAKTLHGNLVYP